MCLEVKRIKPRIAKFNIPVYKVLTIEGYAVKTPIVGKVVQLKVGLKAEGDLDVVKIHYKNNHKYLIGGGIIHCFWSKKAMQSYISFYASMYSRINFICQKAYIPKGTEFFIGRYDSFGQIGAKEIKSKL